VRLTRQAKFGLWAAMAVVVAVVAFLVGGTLTSEEPPRHVFDLTAPAFDSNLGDLTAMSPGGFTGFEDLVPGGSRTVLGGQIVELTAEGMTLETPAGIQTRLRLLETPGIERLESAGRELLLPGAAVLVKFGETEGAAAAVLVISLP